MGLDILRADFGRMGVDFRVGSCRTWFASIPEDNRNDISLFIILFFLIYFPFTVMSKFFAREVSFVANTKVPSVLFPTVKFSFV